jgi:hypothetical protein
MPSTCSQANLLLQDGAGVGSFCDVLGCTATQEDPDTGGLQQITGWEFAGKGIYEGLDENGEPNFVDQYGLFPIWTDVDPGSDYLAQGPAANNGYMVVNGNYVFPTKIDKYNPMEQGKDNYHDLNTFCSTHVTVDQTTGRCRAMWTWSTLSRFQRVPSLPSFGRSCMWSMTGSLIWSIERQACTSFPQEGASANDSRDCNMVV